jgi:hypothetical protein
MWAGLHVVDTGVQSSLHNNAFRYCSKSADRDRSSVEAARLHMPRQLGDHPRRWYASIHNKVSIAKASRSHSPGWTGAVGRYSEESRGRENLFTRLASQKHLNTASNNLVRLALVVFRKIQSCRDAGELRQNDCFQVRNPPPCLQDRQRFRLVAVAEFQWAVSLERLGQKEKLFVLPLQSWSHSRRRFTSLLSARLVSFNGYSSKRSLF